MNYDYRQLTTQIIPHSINPNNIEINRLLNIHQLPIDIPNIHQLYDIVHDLSFKAFYITCNSRYQKLIKDDSESIVVHEYTQGKYYSHYKVEIPENNRYSADSFKTADGKKPKGIKRYTLTVNLYEDEVIFITFKLFAFYDLGNDKIKVTDNKILSKFYIRPGIHRPWLIKERSMIINNKISNKKTKTRYQNRYVSLKNRVRVEGKLFRNLRYYLIAIHNQCSYDIVSKIHQVYFASGKKDMKRSNPGNSLLFQSKNIPEIIKRKIGYRIPLNLVYHWYDIFQLPVDTISSCFKESDYSLVYQNLKKFGNPFRIPSVKPNVVKVDDYDSQYEHIIIYRVQDVIRMSYELGIELSPRLQSIKKFNQLHSDISRQYRLLTMEDLTVHKAYYQLTEKYNWLELIDTKERLLEEATMQHNCVVAYAPKINTGQSAIYSMIHENVRYTLEITKMSKGKNWDFQCVQIYGPFDRDPPDTVINMVLKNL